LTWWFTGLVRSCCDLVLASEPVEDRSAAHVVVGEVDHWWGLSFGLGRCELPECPVWPRGIEVVQVGREDPDAIGGEDRVECPGEAKVSVSKQERHGGGAVGEVHEQVADGLGGPRAGRVRVHAEQRGPAGAVLDRDQRVEPSEKYGVPVQIMCSCT
jgi:hypothetical protein